MFGSVPDFKAALDSETSVAFGAHGGDPITQVRPSIVIPENLALISRKSQALFQFFMFSCFQVFCIALSHDEISSQDM